MAEGAVLFEYPEASEEEANQRAVAAARWLATRSPAGFLDAVPGARTLLVLFDPRRLARGRLAEEARRGAEGRGPGEARRSLDIPVFYGADADTGPDLDEISRGAGLTREEFSRRHSRARYRVAFLGFAPGFPYMTGLPRELRAPRLATPRTRVPAGSVGIGDRYTGIYPGETPGGWRLIGRAPVRLFDAALHPPSLLLPGDSVRFEPIGREEYERRRPALERNEPAERRDASSHLFRVTAPGVFTSVQGGPRRGWALYGVPPGGAMDLEALAGGNAAVGNAPLAPALEMTLVGPELEILADAAVAFSGGSLEPSVNGRPLAASALRQVRTGDRLRLGPVRSGARAYLCMAGGLSRTPDARTSRRLVSGDTVFAAAPADREDSGFQIPDSRGIPEARLQGLTEVRIRVLPGPQRESFEGEGLAVFLGSAFRVSASSDRRGLRLEGPPIPSRRSPDIPPEGTALGGIQVPGDGQPIVLGPDRPVTGGYAKIATVIAADFPLLAQALPGMTVRFKEVTLAEALSASSPESRVPVPASPVPRPDPRK